MRVCDFGRFVVCCAVLVTAELVAARGETPTEARMRSDITFLASDGCEGRGVCTQGINRAADYIGRAFREAGLRPAMPDGGYFQPFTVSGAVEDGPSSLRLRGPGGRALTLRQGDQFQVLGLSHPGKADAPLVFAGYGITTENGYDDYAGLDAAGKVVVVLRELPRAGDRPNPIDAGRRGAALASKLANAVKHGAAAVILVNDAATAKTGDDLLPFGYTATMSSPEKIPAVQVRRAVADDLLRAGIGKGLADLESAIDAKLAPASGELTGWAANLETNVRRGKIPTKNIVGVLDGAGPLANETVVVGAHYDHLGYGGPGSLAGLKKPAIHHGADDNGSGTTALLELARRYGGHPGRQGRRLVFIAFSGEEMGLLGSHYYCEHPLFPLESTVAMVNMDMVGRLRPDRHSGWPEILALLTPGGGELPTPSLAVAAGGVDALRPRDRLTVYGTGTSKGFDALLEELNRAYGFRLKKVPGGFGPSDHASFYAKKVPVYFFFTEDHPDYHRPSDTADKINVTGMRRVTDLVDELVTRLAAMPDRPQYVKVSGGGSGDPVRRSGMPRLGFQPGNYGESEGGVEVGGVIEGGAAARAGIREGDHIVAIAGKPTANMSAYMNVMAAQKKGQPVEVTVERGGKRLTVTATPE